MRSTGLTSCTSRQVCSDNQFVTASKALCFLTSPCS
jgi:hypothetical protein